MTIKKTARAMSVALLLVVAGLVVYGIRVIPALKSGVSWETLTPELAGVLWIAVIFTAVLRRARTDEPVARVPAMVCEWALLVLGLVGYLRRHPDADDEMLADLIAQTLHLDR